jgi:hypothetical protein
VHDEDLDAVEFQVLVQEFDEPLAFFGGDAPRAAVRDLSQLIFGGEVYAGGEVALA